MPNYKILIQDNSLFPLIKTNPPQYNAEQYADNQSQAIQQIKEFYANELDTTEDAIQILSVIQI
jgi:hypothetical protein